MSFQSETILFNEEQLTKLKQNVPNTLLGRSVFKKNLMFLLGRMEKISSEVNDREILKKLRVYMQNTPFDLEESQINEIKRHGYILNEKKIPEGIFPFYRHYQYMIKRDRKYQYNLPDARILYPISTKNGTSSDRSVAVPTQ